MIPFDLDNPAVRTALVRARLQNGGGRHPPPDYPPVTYAPAGGEPDKQTRPSFADDIDRMVDQLVADGDVKLSPDGESYIGTRGAQWRWKLSQKD